MPAYTPAPSPLAANDELGRYVTEELYKIAASFAGLDGLASTVYGGLRIDSENTNLVGASPVVITNWDESRPDSGPKGITASAAAGTLEALGSGVYVGALLLTARIQSGRSYVVETYANGVATGNRGGVQASNQSAALQISLSGINDFGPGAEIDVRVTADTASSQFDIVDGSFTLYRISE